MTEIVRIALAQLDFFVGDIYGNADKIIDAIHHARTKLNADVVVFPELALTGYPPEDLLLRPGLHYRVKKCLDIIIAETEGITVVLGYPKYKEDRCYNVASLIRDCEIIATYHKRKLPNYSVFDEERYFEKGNDTCVVTIKGIPMGIIVCEDLWDPQALSETADAGAKIILTLNASPFDLNKVKTREALLAKRVSERHLPILYTNLIGGQDELVFDGASFAMDRNGKLCLRAKQFSEDFPVVEVQLVEGNVHIAPQTVTPLPSAIERIYQAIILGTKDYIRKNNFTKAIIGVSGGIDSALTLQIAVDALGADKVHAVMMPSRYTAKESIIDAQEQITNLNVTHTEISIDEIFQSFLDHLKPEFKNSPVDATEENIQARVRGIFLMALSNKTGAMVLTTGNKSEMSVGYATLYGDMAGGFAPIKDIPKTLVYELAKYRSDQTNAIPQRVFEKPPSAELAKNQTDQDNLPPYPILDKILEHYIEQNKSVREIISMGFDEETVRKIADLVDHNEYKRRQAPPGVRISERAFGKDRRYPISSGFDRGH